MVSFLAKTKKHGCKKVTLFDTQALINWFEKEKRELPWREQNTPYFVWVSEVMLQQTQVSVVIPYFEKFIATFPTIEALACAKEEEVIKLWEGLGYYSRARRLHKGAQMIVADYKGEIPSSQEELKTIKGLGPYTIGALRSFAFRLKDTAVDGNVLRVASRYFLLEEDISKPKTVAAIRSLIFSVLPEKKHYVFNEALIELGATICKKKPLCHLCPLKTTCEAYKQGKEQQLPIKKNSTKCIKKERIVPLFLSQDAVLIQKGSLGKVMEGLYYFPYYDKEKSNEISKLEKKRGVS